MGLCERYERRVWTALSRARRSEEASCFRKGDWGEAIGIVVGRVVVVSRLLEGFIAQE